MIKNSEKIGLLEKLLDASNAVKVEDVSNPEFRVWKNNVERTFAKVFGGTSREFLHFTALRFGVSSVLYGDRLDYDSKRVKQFRDSFKIIKMTIVQYISEIKEESDSDPAVEMKEDFSKTIRKVFISHASSDSTVVEEVIDLLELIGLESTQIFCTSFEGYSIGLGNNFLDAIREEISSEALVIFILSSNFYNSPVCLCEMGAAWVLAKEHIPILIPPLDFNDVKGVVSSTQGLKIDDAMKLNSLKEKIEELFGIVDKISMSIWERKRDRIVDRIRRNLAI